jgi:multiple antibiotic resistance protein
MVLMSRHSGIAYMIPVYASILLTSMLTWLMLRGAEWMERRLSKTFLNVVTRVMGLILAAIAVEFVINGIKDVLPTLHR